MLQPSPYWGDEADLDEQEQRPQSDVRRDRAASGSRPPCARRRIPTSARQDRIIRRRSCSRSTTPARHLADVRSEDEAAHAHQHLLRHAPPDVRRGRQQHAVDERRRPGRRLAEHEDVRRDARRGEVAGLDRAHHGHERQRQARRVRRAEPAGRSRRRTSGSAAASTPSRRRPTDRSGDRCSGSRAPSSGSCPGSNPPETALAEVYEPPFNNPKRQSRASRRAAMDVDRNGVVWAALASGHMASFDRRKCKGPLNGPTATGPALPRGLDALSGAAAAVQRRDRSRQRRGSYYTWVDQFDTLGLGANTPINTGNAAEGAARAEGRQVGRAARAVSDRLLHEVDGRPDRRSERRMEGPRALVAPSARARRSTWKPARARRAR